jgi:hypothetical protein
MVMTEFILFNIQRWLLNIVATKVISVAI